jgi:hypothetical protein
MLSLQQSFLAKILEQLISDYYCVAAKLCLMCVLGREVPSARAPGQYLGTPRIEHVEHKEYTQHALLL